MNVLSTSKADLLGMTNSALCLVHCLAMPLLVAMGAAILHHPLVSTAFIAVAGFAVWAAVRRSPSRWLGRFLWAAWAVFSLSLLLEEAHHGFELSALVASGLLVLGHGIHWRNSARAPVVA